MVLPKTITLALYNITQKFASRIPYHWPACLGFIMLASFASVGFQASFAADSITAHAQGPNYYPNYPKPNYGSGAQKKLIQRGEYLAKAGDCIACHTKPGGKPFAGGLPIATPFGTFFTPNITPDKKTGIGNWTDKDFIRAMHEGIRPNGSNYFPVFPYTSFTKVSKQDLLAIKAYLDAIPAVNQKNKPPDAWWPFRWRFLQWGWKFLFFKPDYYKYDPNKSKEWNRGAYLVQGLGHCGECHTQRNFLGAMKSKYYLTGTVLEGYWAPDITELGLQGAPIKEIVDVFKKEQLLDKAGKVRGPMAEVDHDSLEYLSDSDLRAIATYLKTVKSPQPYVSRNFAQRLATYKNLTERDRIKIGGDIYDRVCAICHDKGVAGAPRIYDTAVWTYRLSIGGFSRLYKHAIQGYNNMPRKGGCVVCTDNEIRAAVDYIVANSQAPAAMHRIRAAQTPEANTSLKLGQQIYTQHCSVCHDDGKLGAPKLGDQKAWALLLKQNIDGLFIKTLKTHNLPSNGGCTACSNSDILAAIKYMAQKGDPNGDYSLW